MPHRITRVTLNTSTYTSVRAPFICHRAVLSNQHATATITVRTDADDSGTAEDIPAGTSIELIMTGGHGFAANEIVVSAIVDSGTGPLVCRWS